MCMNYNELSDDELAKHIEAYAGLVMSGVSVEENESILGDLVLEQERRANRFDDDLQNIDFSTATDHESSPFEIDESAFIEPLAESLAESAPQVNPESMEDTAARLRKNKAPLRAKSNKPKLPPPPLKKKTVNPLKIIVPLILIVLLAAGVFLFFTMMAKEQSAPVNTDEQKIVKKPVDDVPVTKVEKKATFKELPFGSTVINWNGHRYAYVPRKKSSARILYNYHRRRKKICF